MYLTRKQSLLALLLVLGLATMACVRNLPTGETGGGEGVTTDEAAATKDAAVQQTLEALLGSATAAAQSVAASVTPTATLAAGTATLDADQLAALSATQTAEGFTATPTITNTPGPTATPSATAAPCYAMRFVFDETVPDGTRFDPGEHFQKVWRIQNVGTCEWSTGEYQLRFVSGNRMSGSDPLVVNFGVQPGAYANFAINLVAPTTPGDYRGYWILETTNGETIGWGPAADQSFWVDINVRGATPTP